MRKNKPRTPLGLDSLYAPGTPALGLYQPSTRPAPLPHPPTSTEGVRWIVDPLLYVTKSATREGTQLWVKLLREDAPDTFHVIARCRFSIAKKGRAVGIMRKQLPFTKAWALTINKSQGQTLDGLLLDATAPPFEHGHSYGAPPPVWCF